MRVFHRAKRKACMWDIRVSSRHLLFSSSSCKIPILSLTLYCPGAAWKRPLFTMSEFDDWCDSPMRYHKLWRDDDGCTSRLGNPLGKLNILWGWESGRGKRVVEKGNSFTAWKGSTRKTSADLISEPQITSSFKNSSCSREIKLRSPSNSSQCLCKREIQWQRSVLPLPVPQYRWLPTRGYADNAWSWNARVIGNAQ